MIKDFIQSVLEKIIGLLPTHKLNSIQVMNLIGDILGVVMFCIFVSTKPHSCFLLISMIMWFIFVAWCYERHFKKE